MKNYKTFKDLKFKPYDLSNATKRASVFLRDYYKGTKQASIKFENGYGVSVLLGRCFYSNGVNTYELGILYDEDLTYNTDIADDVLGYITEEEITEIMIKVQDI